mmetsp:Transcript_2522/g.3647  ORF Transcript_2522/g.3647 Transcript_2522/m.3647 type:complete len:258 (+) Transcript_2522:2757-3530(+)
MYLIKKFFTENLKNERFLNIFLYKSKQKTFFIFLCKLCKRTKTSSKHMLYKLFLKTKLSKIKKTQKHTKQLLKKIKKTRNICGFHKTQNMKCFLKSQLSMKKHLIKITLSRFLKERFATLRLNLKTYKKNKFSSNIQGLRLKHLLKYNFRSFRKEILNTMRYILKSGAKGCMIQIKGAHRSKRTKTVRFTRGFVSFAGGPNTRWTEGFYFNLKKKRGVIGIKIKILKGDKKTQKNYKSLFVPGKVAYLKKSSVVTNI